MADHFDNIYKKYGYLLGTIEMAVLRLTGPGVSPMRAAEVAESLKAAIAKMEAK